MSNDRNVFAVRSGSVSRVGFENPRNPRQGFGYRIYVRALDGSVDIYAHMDPASITLAVDDTVSAGQRIGMYAYPPNGSATAAHLHFERRNSNGHSVPPGNISPLSPGARITSGYGVRTHPVTGRQATHHGGIDFVGPAVESSR